jgi:hypothetical protein
MPTTNTVDKPQEIYQIKVTLLGTDPAIWRRLLVPADLTLEQLHHVLQVAMGWEDCRQMWVGHETTPQERVINRVGKPPPHPQSLNLP